MRSTKLQHWRVKYICKYSFLQGVVLDVAVIIAKTPYCVTERGSRQFSVHNISGAFF